MPNYTSIGGVWSPSLELAKGHTLIAGITGSGKSVLENRILSDVLAFPPQCWQLVLIDPKKVELQDYRKMRQCLRYADNPQKTVAALDFALSEMDRRYKTIKGQGKKSWEGSRLLVVIDELADIMTTNRKQCLPRLQRLAQLGRAAGVFLLACTQSPSRKTIPAELVLNFQNRVALRCAFPIESRQIIGSDLACSLPRFGRGYWLTSSGDLKEFERIPPADPTLTAQRLKAWRRSLFHLF